MTTYNAARGMGVDKARLNRALGLAQRKSYVSPYETTSTHCTCPDFVNRQKPGFCCKHMLRLALVTVARESSHDD